MSTHKNTAVITGSNYLYQRDLPSSLGGAFTEHRDGDVPSTRGSPQLVQDPRMRFGQGLRSGLCVSGAPGWWARVGGSQGRLVGATNAHECPPGQDGHRRPSCVTQETVLRDPRVVIHHLLNVSRSGSGYDSHSDNQSWRRACSSCK